jgi:uncharacterized membrane protein
MKKYFVTGLAILMPLALTVAIVGFIFNFLTEPFVGIVRSILDYLGLLEVGFLFLSASQLQTLVSKVIILILLFFFTITLGMLARRFFVSFLLKWWDALLHRIPFVSSIYKTCQEVIKTLFESKAKSFKQVVLVPFPSEQIQSVGFVTGQNLAGLPHSDTENIVAVFVPTTPNPTSGFLMMFKAKELIYLDMKVEEALKYVISCGVVMTSFKTLTPEEALKRSNET